MERTMTKTRRKIDAALESEDHLAVLREEAMIGPVVAPRFIRTGYTPS
jgi:hypothetical protein